MDPNNDNTLN